MYTILHYIDDDVTKRVHFVCLSLKYALTYESYSAVSWLDDCLLAITDCLSINSFPQSFYLLNAANVMVKSLKKPDQYDKAQLNFFEGRIKLLLVDHIWCLLRFSGEVQVLQEKLESGVCPSEEEQRYFEVEPEELITFEQIKLNQNDHTFTQPIQDNKTTQMAVIYMEKQLMRARFLLCYEQRQMVPYREVFNAVVEFKNTFRASS